MMASKQVKNLIKVKKQSLQHNIDHILSTKQLLENAVSHYVNDAITSVQKVQQSTGKELQHFQVQYDQANCVYQKCLDKLLETIALFEDSEDANGAGRRRNTGDEGDDDDEDDDNTLQTGLSSPSNTDMLQISSYCMTPVCDCSSESKDSVKIKLDAPSFVPMPGSNALPVENELQTSQAIAVDKLKTSAVEISSLSNTMPEDICHCNDATPSLDACLQLQSNPKPSTVVVEADIALPVTIEGLAIPNIIPASPVSSVNRLDPGICTIPSTEFAQPHSAAISNSDCILTSGVSLMVTTCEIENRHRRAVSVEPKEPQPVCTDTPRLTMSIESISQTCCQTGQDYQKMPNLLLEGDRPNSGLEDSAIVNAEKSHGVKDMLPVCSNVTLKQESLFEPCLTLFGQRFSNMDGVCSLHERFTKLCTEISTVPCPEMISEMTSSNSLPIKLPPGLQNTPVTDPKVGNAVSSAVAKFSNENWQPCAEYIKPASPVRFLLPKTQLDEGTTLEGVITYVESPSSFYLQPLDADCDRLSDSLSAHYKNTYRSLPEPEQKVGMLCCVKNVKSNAWMRGVITAFKKKEVSGQGIQLNDKFTVKFLDYGWSEDVPLYLLRSLDHSFLSTPTLVVHCSLFGVEPPLSQNAWNADQIVMFRELTCNKTIKVVVRAIHEGDCDSLYEVDLYEVKMSSDQEIEISISDCLIRAKCCHYPKRMDNLGNSSGRILPCSEHSQAIPVEEPTPSKVSFKIAAATPKVVTSQVILHDNSSEMCNGKYDASSESSGSIADKNVHQSVEGHDSPLKVTSHKEEKAPTETCQLEAQPQIPLHILPKATYLHEVVLSNVVSPSEIYLLPVEIASELEKLCKEMNAAYADSEIPLVFVDQATLKVNSFWCAKFPKDGWWYRAKLCEVKEVEVPLVRTSDGKKKKRNTSVLPKFEVLMLYIDIGERVWISSDDLRYLKRKFFDVPAMTVQCSLAYVRCKDGLSWPPEAAEQLRLWCGNHIFKAQVTNQEKYEETQFCEVMLWNFTYGSSKNLFNEYLELLDLAEFVGRNRTQHSFSESGEDSLTTRATNEFNNMVVTNGHDSDEMEQLESWNPMVEEHDSLRNSYNVPVEDPGFALTGYQARDEKDICFFIQRGQICKRGESCPYKHVKPRADGETTDQKEMAYDVPPIQLPSIESVVAVDVTAVISPTHFYVNFPMSAKPLLKLMEEDDEQLTEETENLSTLRKKMQEVYGNSTSRGSDFLLPALGELVVAKYSKDLAWYRAKVIEVNPEQTSVKVFYVDYGNTEWLQEQLIRKILPEFMHLPFQAVECQLANIELLATSEEKQKEATDFFCRCIDDKRLLAKIVDQLGNVLQIELFNASSETAINLNLALANKKYVKFCKNVTKLHSHSSSKLRKVQMAPV